MDFTKEIERIVALNLPEATAKEMRKFITEAEDTKEKLERSCELICSLENKIAGKDKLLKELDRLKLLESKLVSKKCELDIRESELDDRQSWLN